MAKSKILKELANNEISIDIALKRLLLICSDLNYSEVFAWAEKELNGYSKDEPVPEYRNMGVGKILYSGLKGNMHSFLKLSNQPLPVQWIPDQYMDLVRNNYERSTIANIVERSKGDNVYSADLTALAGKISVGIAFTSISQRFDASNYMEIANKVANILFKIFMKLDKEYGNLDELDIETAGKSESDIAVFEKSLVIEIGKLSLVNIGNNNTIKKSSIGEDDV